MNADSYRCLDATALAKGVARGDFSAAEVLETAFGLAETIGADLICPLLRGPKSLLFWIMKEFGNGQEAQAGRDYWQAA